MKYIPDEKRCIEEVCGKLARAASVRELLKHLRVAEAKAALVDELLAAARLAALNFARSDASGNFLGDDDHEAWTALRAAVAKATKLGP